RHLSRRGGRSRASQRRSTGRDTHRGGPPMMGARAILAVTILAVVSACQTERKERTEPAGRGHEAAQHEHEEQAVRLDATQRAAVGISVVEANPGKLDRGVQLLGEVRPNGDRLAHIVPRFPGIVRDVRKSIGDAVKSGETLAVIESSESLAPYELRTLLDGTI